jgi:hemoglobin
MRNARPLVLFVVVALVSACMTQGQAQQPPKSLYTRLGGYDAVAAVSDEFIGRLAPDPQFSRFFAGFSTDSRIRLRQHLVDQLCQATGGPCYYTGRSMPQAHAGLKITEAEWNAAGAHMVASLEKFHVPPREKDEVMAIMTSVRGDVVGR